VLTLLCFGYRIAVTVVERGIRGFFANVVGFVVRFVFAENIAKWIAEQGGWVRLQTHTHTRARARLTALFRDYPGEPVRER